MDIREFCGDNNSKIINKKGAIIQIEARIKKDQKELEKINLDLVELEKVENDSITKIINSLDELQDEVGLKLMQKAILKFRDWDIDENNDDAVEAVALPILNDKELKFYKKHFPKRAGKYGTVGVSCRKTKNGKLPTNPWTFNGFSWLTKKSKYQSFTTKTQAIGFAKGVWNKYPTEAYHRTLSN